LSRPKCAAAAQPRRNPAGRGEKGYVRGREKPLAQAERRATLVLDVARSLQPIPAGAA
jgi:hypothetical protein